jgi:hypothetical protein
MKRKLEKIKESQVGKAVISASTMGCKGTNPFKDISTKRKILLSISISYQQFKLPLLTH